MADRDYGKPKFGYEDRPQPSAPPTPPGRADAAAAGFEIEEVRERGQQAQVGRLPVTSDSPVEVYFQEEAYRQIRNQVMGAAPLKGDPRRHKEAGGILYGEVTPVVGGKYVVNVREAVAVQGGASSRTQFTIGNQDWVTAHAEIRRRRGDDHQLEVVGVYHSHPGHGIFHSATDAQSLGRKGGQFTAPYHFSMVVDHITRSGKSPHGRMGVLVDNVKVGEFNFEAPFPGLFQAQDHVSAPASAPSQGTGVPLLSPAAPSVGSRLKEWFLILVLLVVSPAFALLYLYYLVRAWRTDGVIGTTPIEDWELLDWASYLVLGLIGYLLLFAAWYLCGAPSPSDYVRELVWGRRPYIVIEDANLDVSHRREQLTCTLNHIYPEHKLRITMQAGREEPSILEVTGERLIKESEHRYQVEVTYPRPLVRDGDYSFSVSYWDNGKLIAESDPITRTVDLPPAKIAGLKLRIRPISTGVYEKTVQITLSWKAPVGNDLRVIHIAKEEADAPFSKNPLSTPTDAGTARPAETEWQETLDIYSGKPRKWLRYRVYAEDAGGKPGEEAVSPVIRMD